MNVSRISRLFYAGLALALTAPTAAFAQGAVRTLTLDDAIDPAAAGAIDPGAARLPAGLWRGSDRAEAANQVAATPARIGSPTLRDLAKRVLAVAAEPPAGAQLAPGFASMRAAALLRMGEAGLAASLMGAVPRSQRSEAADLLFLDSSLLAQDRSGACAVARSRIGRADSIVFAQASAFCEALAGDRTRAEFQAALIAERAPDETAYFQLLDLVTGATDKPGRAIKRLKDPTPLHIAMLDAAGQPPRGLPKDKDTAFALALERLAVRDPGVALKDRTVAGWRTLVANAADLDPLRQLFLAGASNPPKSPGGKVIAKFAEVVAVPPGPDRAVGLAELLMRGADADAGPQVAHLAGPLLAALQPIASGPDIAGRVARGLILTNEMRPARRWLASLDAASAVPGAADQSSRLMQLLALATGRDVAPFLAPDVGLWFGAVGADAGKAALLADLRAAAGLLIPPELTAISLTWSSERPTLPRVDDLAAVAAAGKIGEAALIATQAVAAAEAKDRPFALAAAARALGDVGLTDDARRLAVEAAIAGGL